MPTLRVLLPNAPAVSYPLAGERITVGRRPDNTIQIIDRSVSAHHAEFLLSEGHYRLHDLQSTNLTFVEGQPISDFHLHQACALAFGTVSCEFNPTTALVEPSAEARLTPAQMENDLKFLREENQTLINRVDALQRQIDILSSARLVTGKSEMLANGAGDEIKRLLAERDELRFQNSGLRMELDKVRDELAVAFRERDHARQVHEVMHIERLGLQESNSPDKGATQRIVFPSPAMRE